jgi:glycosyltransferase involved in cell wall biosynthesis
MKKLLAIAPYSYLPYYSGGQKFIALFFEYLGRETDLTVISVRENDFSLAKSYKALPILKKSFFRYLDPTLPFKIIALIKKNKYDSIIWEHPYYAWAAYRVKKKTGIKTIIHSHNIEHQRFHSIGKWWWRVLRVYEKWFFKFADTIFFITEEDRRFAIENWNIDTLKCIDVPFGIEMDRFPNDRQNCKKEIKARHGITEIDNIFLFNGVLDYKPNLDALNVILKEINPLLLAQPHFNYKIIVCGKKLPSHFNSLLEYADKNIIYAGFVEDIETYFKGSDLFLNPVQSGGGIKTKMVEAIGFGTTVIATHNGAAGIDRDVCGNKLIEIPGSNAKYFANAITKHVSDNSITPSEYYDTYFLGNIVKRVINFIDQKK